MRTRHRADGFTPDAVTAHRRAASCRNATPPPPDVLPQFGRRRGRPGVVQVHAGPLVGFGVFARRRDGSADHPAASWQTGTTGSTMREGRARSWKTRCRASRGVVALCSGSPSWASACRTAAGSAAPATAPCRRDGRSPRAAPCRHASAPERRPRSGSPPCTAPWVSGLGSQATVFSKLASTSGRSRAMKWPAFGTCVKSAAGSRSLFACRSEGRDQSFSP